MRWISTAVLALSLSVLAACAGGGGQGSHDTVSGTFVRVGGPPPGAPFPLPGKITARSDTGATFTVSTGSSGRFKLSLPPGTYHVTGRSPLIQGGKTVCAAAKELHVTATASGGSVTVVCSIS
jgi:hypothetical protein